MHQCIMHTSYHSKTHLLVFLLVAVFRIHLLTIRKLNTKTAMVTIKVTATAATLITAMSLCEVFEHEHETFSFRIISFTVGVIEQCSTFTQFLGLPVETMIGRLVFVPATLVAVTVSV